MVPPSSVPASLAGGRYLLDGPLGVGAMASVFRAYDTRLGVDRAIKVLTPGPKADRRAWRRRLRAEARAMARLRHPHVVAVYDIGAEGPFDYIVMDLADGGTLSTRLRDEGPLPPDRVAQWMIEVLSALAAAHAQQIVHRDVKPDNILLDGQGRALLADFGIALLADQRRTQTGTAMGSAAFTPPEQRLDASSVTPRADLYAVGTTLYALVTQRNPVDLFFAEEESDRWETVDPKLVQVIRRACARFPAERYASAGEMAEALRALYPLAGAVRPVPLPAPGAVLRRSELAARHDFAATSTSSPTLVPTIWRRPGRWALGRLSAAVITAVVLLLGRGPSRVEEVTVRDSGLPADRVSANPVAADAHGAALAEAAPVPVRPASAVVRPPARRAVLPTAVVRAAPPAWHAPAPDGTWTMFRNGVLVTLVLSVMDEVVQGTLTSSIGRKHERVDVRGNYDVATRRLSLSENAHDARYDIVLDAGLQEGRGSVYAGDVVRSLKLTRADEPRAR